MSETERAAAQQAYADRQRQYELERAEKARRDAAAAEVARREAEDKARRDREQVEAVHRGESGVYGDLIRVTISGGTMEFYGKRMPYEPITFTLANQERRTVSFRSAGGGRAYRTLDVPVSYVDGTFTFDVGRGPIRLLRSPRWKRGELHEGLVVGKHSVSDGQGLTLRLEIVPQTGVVVVGPRGTNPDRPTTPPAVPAGRRGHKTTRVETYGTYPDGFRSVNNPNQCINMSPFEEHLKAPIALKSFVIERNGIAAVVEIIEVKTHDTTQRKSICRTDRSRCQESSDWMALNVNGTVMFLHAQEVKRLEFDNGAALLLSALAINDHQAKPSSALCWD